MIAVVVGDIDRSSKDDRTEVLFVMEELRNTYRDLTIVSAACERGVGHIVRSHCLKNPKNPEFGFVEVDIKPWARLSKPRLTQIYTARNATLLEIGEEFHIFTSGWTQGHVADLIKRVKDKNLPLVIYHRNGTKDYFNLSQGRWKNDLSTDTLKSTDLKSELE
jgi:hypothetical protein